MIAHLLAGLLVALPSAPAVPEPTDPPPTDVTLAWDPTASDRFVVTWKETGPQRNAIEVVDIDGSPSGYVGWIIGADEPNRFAFYTMHAERPFRITVTAVDANGDPISDLASSPAFDTDFLPDPVVESLVPAEDGTVAMRWRPGVYTDSTPNDPLDLPAENPQRFVPLAVNVDSGQYEELSPPSAATSIVVPARQLPAWFAVRTPRNEWGSHWDSGSSATERQIVGTRLTATVPATATTGKSLQVTGRAYDIRSGCGGCSAEEQTGAYRPVQLQSRTGATAAWKVVSSTSSTKSGDFRFSIASPGSRQYRVVAPPIPMSPTSEAKGFFATAPASTISRPPAAATTPGRRGARAEAQAVSRAVAGRLAQSASAPRVGSQPVGS